MTRDTETLFYNIRMIIDSKVETQPRAWLISKINRISPNGIVRVTLTQDTFDQRKDYIEKDEDGNIIGMWANYWNSSVEPEPILPDVVVPDDEQSELVTSTITCSGKPQFKIGGSAKTFTVTYYDEEGQELPDHTPGIWQFFIDNDELSPELFNLIQDGNKVKVKFLGDDSYIGKIVTITNTSEDSVGTLQIEIIAL